MTETPVKVRSKTAMEFARVDRQRFNDMVAAGKFPCAPRTARGQVRLFEVNDIVTLYIFGRLCDLGLTPPAAAHYACRFDDKIKHNPEEKIFWYLRDRQLSGPALVVPHSRYKDWAASDSPHSFGPIGQVGFRFSFDVRAIRDEIIEAIEEMKSTIGYD
ncbi:MAG: hypothetical protein AAFY02_11575 [Pseudomonadota bacterium]